MVNDLKERILEIPDEHPTVTNIVLHTGSNDVSKQQSEVLKRDFIGLLNTVSSLNATVFISGAVPPVRGGEERFSRLLALNKWLLLACADHSVHFINNFNIFCERRHLFKANGFNFKKSGVKLFTSNIFYFLRHPSVLGAKAEINEELSHREEQTNPSRNLEEELHLPPPKRSFGKERHQRQEEGSLFAPNPLNSTNDQDQGPGPGASPAPQTPDRSSRSSPSLSPSSPHLKFTEEMMERVNAGLRSTPQPEGDRRTVWGSSCTDHSRKALQRIVNTAGKITGAPLPLPSLKDIYTTRLTRKATSIASDTSHPAHSLFSLLPSGRRYRSLRCRTTRLRDSFIHQAVRKLNSLPSLPPDISVSLT